MGPQPDAAPIERDLVSIATRIGSLQTYVARPLDHASQPGILLIHEVFGLTPHIEHMADRFASAGYLAAAPNLFTGDAARNAITIADIEAGIAAGYSDDPKRALESLPSEQRDGANAAIAWRATLPGRSAGFVDALTETLHWLQGLLDLRGERVGAIGWCFGGGLLGTLACTGAPLDAAVIYYGAPPNAENVPNVQCPILGHYGSEDPRITDEVPTFEAAMANASKPFTRHIYDAPHAFNNDSRASYRPEAALTAWDRTLAFFDTHLHAANDAR
jgi:carboxymethylenebutenolidase